MKEIIEAVFYYVFHHVVAAVFLKQGYKRSEVTVWVWLVVEGVNDLAHVVAVFHFEAHPQLGVKSAISIVLQYALAHIVAAALVAGYIPQRRALLLYDFT